MRSSSWVLSLIHICPLTEGPLAQNMMEWLGEEEALSFYDAAAPIVSGASLDMDKAYFASRYGKGTGLDYINCPMDKEQYLAFWQEPVSYTHLAALSSLRGTYQTTVGGRSISYKLVMDALSVFLLGICSVAIGTFMLSAFDGVTLSAALFECTSAFGTVGLTLGITPERCV